MSYKEVLNRIARRPKPIKADPRLVALVRYLAQRAAERDYKRLLDERFGNSQPVSGKDIS